MAFDETDEERIQAIESKLNEIQLAVNSLATKTQLNQLLILISKRLTELETEITQVEETGYGGALGNHRADTSAHANLVNYFNKNEHIDTSTGVADAGKPILLNNVGQLDASLFSADDDISAHTANTGIHSNVRSFGLTINGHGVPIKVGGIFASRIQATGTITGWELVADQPGNLVIDVWRDSYLNFPPTLEDSITGLDKPTLSSTQIAQNHSLTEWSIAVTEGDWIFFKIDSADIVTYATLSIIMEIT